MLVVDDEPGVRRALERGLRAEGMEVVTAADGNSGLRAALTGSFDVVLLDIMLPGLSGYGCWSGCAPRACAPRC